MVQPDIPSRPFHAPRTSFYVQRLYCCGQGHLILDNIAFRIIKETDQREVID